MLNPLNKIRHGFGYIHRNIIYPRILNFKYRDVLKNNLELKNIHSNKRCFIFGNGPSVKNLDLNKFRNEYIFVVNEFDRHPQFKNLEHVYHIIADPYYFVNDKNTYFWERIKNKSDTANKNTSFIFHIAGKNLIKKENLFTKNKVYYLSTQGIMSEHFDFNIELNKTVPWPKNSLLSCLMASVYMGFREIYLLGCDHDFLATRIGLDQGKPKTFDHFYENEELKQISTMEPGKAKEKLAIRYKWDENMGGSYEQLMVQILQLFKNYRLFYNKAMELHPDIKIFNATPGSYLDVFPGIEIKEVIK